jgi:hypothetical protein
MATAVGAKIDDPEDRSGLASADLIKNDAFAARTFQLEPPFLDIPFEEYE